MGWLFPEQCLGCGQLGAYFCPTCAATLPRTGQQGQIITALNYHDPKVKRAIWLLKYGGTYSLATTLAQLLYQQLIASNFPSTTSWLVVPIPLSQQRRKKRGYNQSEKIAQELVKINPTYFTLATGVLEKVKDTPSQVSIKNRAARLANLRDAFAVSKPEKIRGQHILIVDDVITTGATTSEIKKVLEQADAKAIIIAAIARG